MADGTLEVTSELLQRGARAFEEHRLTMSEAVDDIDKRYEELRDVWTGAAATSTSEQWASFRETLSTHIAKLEDHAKTLSKTAEMYTAQEDTTKGNIEATGQQLT